MVYTRAFWRQEAEKSIILVSACNKNTPVGEQCQGVKKTRAVERGEKKEKEKNRECGQMTDMMTCRIIGVER